MLAVMSMDVTTLVEALRADPAQRAVLRDALGLGSADVQGALAELAQAQARTELRVEELAQAQARTELRVEELAQAQARTELRVEELAQAQARTELRVEELAQAQARTDARLDELSKTVADLSRQVGELTQAVRGLLDVTAGMQDRLAKLDGSDLERRYRERGPAYLLRVARRLRLIDSASLGELAHDAEDAGHLSEREVESLMAADAVFSGQRRDDRQRVHLVVEVSVTVARNDLRRARERADLLARVVEGPILAVAAGDYVPGPVAQAAQDADVWCVARGRVLPPDGDLDDWV